VARKTGFKCAELDNRDYGDVIGSELEHELILE
jgi:hypothetical protein